MVDARNVAVIVVTQRVKGVKYVSKNAITGIKDHLLRPKIKLGEMKTVKLLSNIMVVGVFVVTKMSRAFWL
jgi:hypothetical protein